MMNALMYALTSGRPQLDGGGPGPFRSVSASRAALEEDPDNLAAWAFVITDVESSTQASSSAPGVFVQLQDIHDQVRQQGTSRLGFCPQLHPLP